MSQRRKCVALKIVFENRLVYYKYHLKGLKCPFNSSHKFQKINKVALA